jgi:hypothetical protein
MPDGLSKEKCFGICLQRRRINLVLRSSPPPSSQELICDSAAEGIYQAATLDNILCKSECCLGSLLNAGSLAFSVFEGAICFGLNLDGPGYDLLRSPLGFSENCASDRLRLGYYTLSFGVNCRKLCVSCDQRI